MEFVLAQISNLYRSKGCWSESPSLDSICIVSSREKSNDTVGNQGLSYLTQSSQIIKLVKNEQLLISYHWHLNY